MISRVTSRSFAALRMTASVVLLSTACGTKEAPGPLQPSGPTGRVRFVNLITDNRGPVNAILEGVPFGVNLTYTQSAPITLAAPSTAPYAAVYAGGRTFVVKRTADTTVTVASLPFTSVATQDQTVYAVGGASATAVAAVVSSDSNPAVAATQARVRFVQLSPGAGAIDLFITAVGADLSTATPTFVNVPYRNVSSYLLLAPGTYQVRAVPAGTAPASRAAAVTINLASLVLAGGSARTIVAADNVSGGSPLRAFVLTDR
jgi:hypothetical protein